jgi:hypothetical protein
MAMNQGVDAQVQNRVDAYRSNPQQLMQMYQQNQELVDLLALQKLKSEKEAAARDMQLKMQQQPGTIAQQREQEVLQLTKNELAQQTQGVLQRKQQQEQANIQRAAQGGIGALAQQRPAPAPQAPMPQMAGGGIVAFKPGGAVEGGDRGARVRERLAEYGVTSQDDWQRLSPEVRDRITRAVNAASGAATAGAVAGFVPAEINDLLADPFKAVGNLGIAASNTGVGMAMGLSDPRRPNEPFEYNANRARMLENIRENALSAEDALAGLPAGPTQDLPEDLDVDAPMRAPGARDIPTMAGIGELPTGPDVPRGPGQPISAPPAPATAEEAISTSETPATASETPRPPASGGTGLAGLAGGAGGMGGAEAALMRGVRIGEDVLGRGEKAGRFAEMEAQLAELDEELYDPEAERRQQLQAFLIGTAGATNVGYAMAGGAAAAINLENRQKQNRRSRMVDRIALSERGMALDSELGRAALSLGNQMFSDFNANQRTAMSAAATLQSAELRAASEAATLEFNREKEANDGTFRYAELEVREAEAAIEQARNDEVAVGRRIQGVLTATDNLLRRSNEAYERGAERYGVEDAAAELSLLTPEDDGYEAAKARFDTVTAEADAWATQYLEERGINDRLEVLEQQFYELSGVEGMQGINPDDILDVQQQ